MERTTAFGLWRYAKEFFEAAKKIQEPSNSIQQKISIPAYYLLGHSIELSLKAFLKAQGFTIEKLKNKYGHDLEWEWS